MSVFSKRNLPVTLAATGIALNVIDTATQTEGTAEGGVVFGPSGILTPIDSAIPTIRIPGTEIPMNTAGWLVVIGVLLWLWMKLR